MKLFVFLIGLAYVNLTSDSCFADSELTFSSVDAGANPFATKGKVYIRSTFTFRIFRTIRTAYFNKLKYTATLMAFIFFVRYDGKRRVSK